MQGILPSVFDFYLDVNRLNYFVVPDIHKAITNSSYNTPKQTIIEARF